MVQEFLQNLRVPAWNAMVDLLLGAALCFAGYKLFKSFRKGYGAVLGIAAGLALSPTRESTARLIAAALAGAAGLFLTDLVYYFGLAATGGVGTGVSAAVVISHLTQDPTLVDVGTITALVSGAALTVILPEIMMILVTAGFGSVLCMIGYHSLQRPVEGQAGTEINLTSVAVVALAGMLSQYLLYRWESGVIIFSKKDHGEEPPRQQPRP